MNKAFYPNLFRPLRLNGLRLKNRITMAPLYLGYAAHGGKISPLLLDHYRLMARSGAALIVVENSSITPTGSGSARTLRCDHERYMKGLGRLANTIKKENALQAFRSITPGVLPMCPSLLPLQSYRPLTEPLAASPRRKSPRSRNSMPKPP